MEKLKGEIKLTPETKLEKQAVSLTEQARYYGIFKEREAKDIIVDFVKGSINYNKARNNLFKILTKLSPEKAMRIEFKYLEKKGKKIENRQEILKIAKSRGYRAAKITMRGMRRAPEVAKREVGSMKKMERRAGEGARKMRYRAGEGKVGTRLVRRAPAVRRKEEKEKRKTEYSEFTNRVLEKKIGFEGKRISVKQAVKEIKGMETQQQKEEALGVVYSEINKKMYVPEGGKNAFGIVYDPLSSEANLKEGKSNCIGLVHLQMKAYEEIAKATGVEVKVRGHAVRFEKIEFTKGGYYKQLQRPLEGHQISSVTLGGKTVYFDPVNSNQLGKKVGNRIVVKLETNEGKLSTTLVAGPGETTKEVGEVAGLQQNRDMLASKQLKNMSGPALLKLVDSEFRGIDMNYIKEAQSVLPSFYLERMEKERIRPKDLVETAKTREDLPGYVRGALFSYAGMIYARANNFDQARKVFDLAGDYPISAAYVPKLNIIHEILTKQPRLGETKGIKIQIKELCTNSEINLRPGNVKEANQLVDLVRKIKWKNKEERFTAMAGIATAMGTLRVTGYYEKGIETFNNIGGGDVMKFIREVKKDKVTEPAEQFRLLKNICEKVAEGKKLTAKEQGYLNALTKEMLI
ncbi:hypothetical protein KAW38_00555 [Candidatus Micrarchaeota archaeon]|nr:hypothetical protein [Candidatus Micrarchaeota archaeon]